MNNHESAGFYVFNYEDMDTSYGEQAFKAIYSCLLDSSGTCAFYDGDLDCEILQDLAKQASYLEPFNAESPLTDLDTAFQFGAYLVSTWTDTHENLEKLHSFLKSNQLPGYLGYFRLKGQYEFPEFQAIVSQRLHLVSSIALKNGELIKGTSKYGIGVRRADAELLWAARQGDTDAVKQALREGADVECIDYYDRVSTPLMHAASEGHASVVQILLDHGASPNVSNRRNTALMLAARFGYVDVVKALIAGGVDANEQASDGSTAYDNAEDHPEVQRLLRDAMLRGRTEASPRNLVQNDLPATPACPQCGQLDTVRRVSEIYYEESAKGTKLAAMLVPPPKVAYKPEFGAEEEAQKVKQIDDTLWKIAMEKWNAIHYCSHCDGAFAPGENRLVSIEDSYKLW